ncbi:extracellular solute-binding protein [Rhizobium sp. TRM96647]|uniref:extracellular solute-binding protein n=1 Tax=unclassified Rhizobium TaxID=2613769 RepID=UPI0021E78F50|nr:MULTISPECIES: extracellular solute-binding protein [unclassified Rhizobium]MCV3738842.1 extracellular solute-binding protein [Rhizobium sp. TRM96647]MCV3760451.1 extracellular solute-binding protein [Rhizobium sp. TRM96650]
MTVTLKGMTWSHPRGYDPMVRCSEVYKEKTGIEIVWEKRSLQDFESFPVDELARAYDLIVIDHPHVGQVTQENCLLPLDVEGREAEREALGDASVGPSYRSYFWQGRQWAFPIDAATQVQAFRPDLAARAPRRWEEVVDLAREGRVLLPLRAPHALMTFYTLAANTGRPCSTVSGDLIDAAAGARVYDLLKELVAHLDPACFDMDPIQASEAMADGRIACIPYTYGYVSYALEGFRDRRLDFADIPAAGTNGPVGGTLGGTGIAVSAYTKHPESAIDFAYWISAADAQRGPYAAAGGQPGHAAAWEDDGVNAPAWDFYKKTRATLEGSYLRPRHDGYMPFQAAASERISAGLKSAEAAETVIADLNDLYRNSFT